MPDDARTGRLIFVRHGRTAWNEDGRCQGWEDEPLDELGKLQAVQVAARLESWRVDAIVSSDLCRARMTADAIGKATNVPVQGTPGLREVNFGTCQGLRLADYSGTEFGRVWKEFRLGQRFEALPGGEHPRDALARAEAVLHPLIDDLCGRNVVIVGHGSTFRLVFCSLLKIPLELWRNLDQGNTAITVFDIEGDRVRLALFNDTCHLHQHGAEQHLTNLVHAE